MKKLLLLLFILLARFLYSQNEVGDQHSIDSRILGMTKNIWVFEPKIIEDDLDNPQKKFPVVFVLDGEENFLQVVATCKSLQRASLMPSVIVVGVSGKNREYDYSPTDLKVDYMKTGGGDKFLQFMQNELIPFLDEKYETTSHRTIIGHSIGAMFGFYALNTSPELFSNYLNISPSLWWDGEKLADKWLDFLSKPTFEQPKKLFISMADEFKMGKDGMSMYHQYERYKKVLRNSEDLRIDYGNFQNENHLSVVVPSVHYGLKFLFSDWNIDHLYSDKNLSQVEQALSELSATYQFNVAPGYADIVNLGRAFHNEKKYEEAIKAFQLGLPLYSSGLQLNGYLAESYEKLEELDQAKKYYEFGLEKAKERNSPMISWFEERLNKLK